MTYYGLPEEPWVNNPFTKGPDAVDTSKRVNDALVAGAWANRFVAEKAQFMRPEQAMMFHRWATAHPTANPRTWAPLAKAGIDPYSEAGASVAAADIASAAYKGTYEATIGQKSSGAEPPQSATDPDAVEDEEDNPWGPDWAHSWLGFASQNLNPLGVVRLGFTAGSTPIQFMEAEARSNLGAEDFTRKTLTALGEKHGLNDEQLVTVNRLVTDNIVLMGEEATLENLRGSNSLLGLPQDQFDAFIADYETILETPQAQEKVDTSIGKAWDQTDSGVILKSVTDGHRGNLWTSRPEDGSKFDPKTGRWINPETGAPANYVDYNGLFVSDAVRTEAEYEAVKAYDIRTVEEAKNKVAPVAWTLGRGMAHRYFDADETAFWVVSGLGDIAKQFVLDPMNLVPVGAIANVSDLTLAGRAFSGQGQEIAVATRIGQYGPGGVRMPPAAQWARPGSVLNAKNVLDDVGTLNPQVGRLTLGDEFLARGYLVEDLGGASKVVKFSDEMGLVNVPHQKFVVKDQAWKWLHTKKGIRVTDYLVGETSAYNIWQKSNQKIDFDLAQVLARAQSPEEVRAILGTRIGYDLNSARQLGNMGGAAPVIGKVPIFGDVFYRALSPSGKELESSGIFTQRGRSAFQRMQESHGYLGAMRSMYRSPFRLSPSSGVGVSAEDTTALAEEMTRFLRGARMPEDRIRETIDSLASAANGPARYNAVYNEQNGVLSAVVNQLVEEQGINPTYARQITRAFPGAIDDSHRIFANSDLGSMGYGTRSADGTLGRAMLRGEALGLNIYLPDYRTIRRTTGIVGKLDKMMPDGAKKASIIGDALTQITSVWRDLVLVRPAYVLREVGEMAFSASLAGGKGPLTHPLGFLALASQAALAMHVHTLTGRVFKGALTGPLKGIRYAIDEAGRLLVRNEDERAAWKAFASLPDDDRPEILRGLSEQGIDDLWHSFTPQQRTAVFWDLMDKEALEEYLLYNEGLSWLFPSVQSKQARLNGTRMYDELWKAADGDDVAYQRFQYELNATSGNLVIDEPAVRGATRHVRPLLRDEEHLRREYVKALIDTKLSIFSHDEIMKALARGEDPDQYAAAWRESDDWLFRREMRPDLWGHPDDLTTPPSLATVNVGDDINYVRGHSQMLAGSTGDDPTLIEAIAKGKYNDKPIDSSNKGLVNYIISRMDDDEWRARLPDKLHDIPYKGPLATYYRNTVNGFFSATGEISDLFARAPMVRKFWTDRILELADDLSPEARQAAVARLRQAGDIDLAKKVLRSGREKAVPSPNLNRGTLTIEEADAIASGYARRMMAKTFYNAHRRQNYAVAMRTIMPFIQSTMNTFKRWGAMSLQNPHLAYRTLKPIEALYEPGSAVIYEVMGNITGDDAMSGLFSPGHPEASVDGFFFTNQYGDRVFAFPAVRNVYNFLANAGNAILPGEPMNEMPEGALALARAQNLNVAGSSWNPGFGPLVTFPAALFAHERIYYDDALGDVLRAAFPYGLPNDPQAYKRFFDSFAPTAVKRVMVSPDDQANAASKLLPSLIATGEYDIESGGDLRRLFADANELASRSNWFAGVFGSATPTTFNWAYAIEVTEGDKFGMVRTTMMQDRLAQEFRKYTAPRSPETAADDYSNGALRFVKDYGTFALYSVFPRTQTVDTPISVTPTADVWSFRTEEPEAYEKWRGVIGIFFPGGDPVGEWTEAESALYSWQKASGERKYKTVEDYWDDVNTSIGWLLYGDFNRQLAVSGISPEQQSVMRAVKADEIASKYPGWTNSQTNPGQWQEALAEIEDAVQDETIQTLPGTPYIATYLEARRDSIASLQDRGYTGTLSAQYATIERANLAALAGRLAAEDSTGTFAYAWARFFSDELEVSE